MGKKKKKGLKSYDNMGYLFVLPFVVVFLIFSVYPVFRTLYLSFTNAKIAGVGEMKWVWFSNYIRVFTDKFFWKGLWNTVRIWGVNIVLQLGLAFLLTIVFSDIKYKIKGLGIFRVIYYLPNLIAATSIAFLFKRYWIGDMVHLTRSFPVCINSLEHITIRLTGWDLVQQQDRPLQLFLHGCGLEIRLSC